jgi:hypothetical protein
MKVTTISRRAFTSAAALAAAGLAAPAVWSQSKLEKTRIAIAVGGKAAFYYLPLTTSAEPPTSACSAREPPAKSEISTSSPSALK